MRKTTANCSKYGQQEFSVAFKQNQVVARDVEWLVGWLESQVADGKRFLPGETIQIGWMITKVESFDDGLLKICEPDMESFPVKFVDSIAANLSHLRFQKMIAESIGLEDGLTFPSLNHSAVTCNWLKEHVGFFMDRIEPKATDSGWFIGCDDPNHNHQDPGNLERKSLYEIAVRWERDIVQYLALPAGISVHVRDGVPDFYRGKTPLPILPHSYLANSLAKK